MDCADPGVNAVGGNNAVAYMGQPGRTAFAVDEMQFDAPVRAGVVVLKVVTATNRILAQALPDLADQQAL
jgi:hypothetical protein